MKYIRTKDGRIYDVKKYSRLDIDDDGNYHLWHKPEFSCLYHIDIDKEDIVKISDTIEELCDEFVIVLGNGLHRFVRRLSGQGKGGITWYRQRNYKIVNIYGAIWTDKGLIYVAKMNDK